MKTCKFMLMGGVAVVALLGGTRESAAAACGTVTCYVQSSGTAPFAALNLGSASTGYQGNATILNPGDGIASISFSGTNTGVYAGNTPNLATTVFPLGTPPSSTSGSNNPEYLAVQPGGTITITFTSAQTSFDLFWGTVDGASGYNVITDGGTTVTGAQIIAAGGLTGSGTTNTAVELSGLPSFTTLTFQDTTGNSPAFEFDPGAPVSTPEPASLALLGAGLCGVGFFRRKKPAS